MDRPSIFISGVPVEFRSFRESIRELLVARGIRCDEQTHFPIEYAEVQSALDEKIRASDGVICLVGELYGSEPGEAANGYPRRSYAQIEHDLARKHGKSVYLFFASGPESFDQRPFEGDEKRKLQSHYINELQRQNPRWRSFTSKAELESQVGELQVVLDSQRTIGPSLLRVASDPLVGRDEVLQRLDAAWNDVGTNVLVIRAASGVGKTALLATWLAQLEAKDWPSVRRKFEWSFHGQGTSASGDAFIASALEFFGDHDPQQGSAFDRGARLAALVAKSKALLVLDGLEALQQPAGTLEAQLSDPAVAALLIGLAEENAGLCIVTTREPINDLATFRGRGVAEIELGPLSEDSGAALLRSVGVAGSDAALRSASREVNGHALTLRLMAHHLVLAEGGDIEKRQGIGFSEADVEVQGGHAFRVLSAHERWLAQEDPVGLRELAILRLLSVFDRPAEPHCIAALGAPPSIAGLTDALTRLDEQQWAEALDRLERKGLVTRIFYQPVITRGYNEQQARDALKGVRRLAEAVEFYPPPLSSACGEQSLDVHPLVRERFARRLRQENMQAWREAHRRLFEHWRGRTPYWPEGLPGLQSLYQAIVHGCRAGLHPETYNKVYRDRVLRGAIGGDFYSITQVGAVGADLGALACFFEAPWRRVSAKLPRADQTWLLEMAASSLRVAGRVTEALEPAQACFDMAVERGEQAAISVAANRLSEMELMVGSIDVALDHAEKAVYLADRERDVEQRIVTRSVQAEAMHQAARREEARAMFAEAEKLQAEREPEQPRLRSLPGFNYADLLLAAAERGAWAAMLDLNVEPSPETAAAVTNVIARAEQGLAADTGSSLFDLSLEHLTLARAALYEELLRMADSAQLSGNRRMPAATRTSDHLTTALNGLRRAANIDHIPHGLLTRAWLRFVRGDQKGCRDDLDDAWRIALRNPMRLQLADIHLTRARLFRDKKALAGARELIESSGYRRRHEELADAEQAAQSWA